MITAEKVKYLRDLTGSGMHEVKESLKKAGGDPYLALGLLKVKGVAVAINRREPDGTVRPATEQEAEFYWDGVAAKHAEYYREKYPALQQDIAGGYKKVDEDRATMEWVEYTSGRIMTRRDHGDWQITPRASENLWDLRYGRHANKYGAAMPEPIGHFASVAEAKLAVEMYEECVGRGEVPVFEPDAAFRANPYNSALMSATIDDIYLMFKVADDGVYCDLEIEDGMSEPIGGMDACTRTDEGSRDLVLCDRPPGLSSSRELDAVIMMEIMAARRRADGLAVPLTEDAFKEWLGARRAPSLGRSM